MVLSGRIYSDGFDAELVFNECDWFGCDEWDGGIWDWWKPGGGAFCNQQVCDETYNDSSITKANHN